MHIQYDTPIRVNDRRARHSTDWRAQLPVQHDRPLGLLCPRQYGYVPLKASEPTVDCQHEVHSISCEKASRWWSHCLPTFPGLRPVCCSVPPGQPGSAIDVRPDVYVTQPAHANPDGRCPPEVGGEGGEVNLVDVTDHATLLHQVLQIRVPSQSRSYSCRG